MRVEVFGHSWLLHKTGLDFENFIINVKMKATAAEQAMVLQEGVEVSIQDINKFLIFVLTRHHLLNDPYTLKFFELNKVAHVQPRSNVVDESSSSNADSSTTYSSEYENSVSHTSDSSAPDADTQDSNNSSNNSSTNTINLSYEPSNDILIVDRHSRETPDQRSRVTSRASHFSSQSFDVRRSNRVITHQPLSRSDGTTTPMSIPAITTTPCPTEVPPSPPPPQLRMFLLAPPLPPATPPPPYDFEVENDTRAKTTFQNGLSRPRSATKSNSIVETVERAVNGSNEVREIIVATPQEEKTIAETNRTSVITTADAQLGVRSSRMSPSDFKFLGVIGKGSFGQVLLARHIATNKPYAVKMLSKRIISRRKETQHVLSERSVLIKVLHHPYLVQLHYAFTTRHKIFFVLDFVNGGELFFHLQRERVFSEPRATFYAAEICCALTYMHTKEIVYRDLKPENLLLDKEGHVVLTDFGLCKEGIQSSSSRTGTFCGTPEYLAPEILLKKPYTRVVDWWTLGAVLYEMLYGLPPFYSSNQMVMYEAIISKPLKLKHGPSSRARNLLSALLKKKPEDRLGFGPEDGKAVMRHEFFRSVDWEAVEQRKLKPPFVPKVTSDTDTRNIDPSFTREPVRLGSVCPPHQQDKTTAGEHNPFKGFSYARPMSDSSDEADEEPDR
ncbi:Protein kinase domain [Trinorchestia longiramus]|nr:Protein kinase domain [Trinorchestia longiramus]